MSLFARLKNHTLEGILALALATSITSLTPSSLSPANAQQTTPANTTALPHYLRDIQSPQDPVKNLFEKWRVYTSLLSKYPDEPSTPQVLNESIQHTTTIHGKKVTFTFIDYVLEQKPANTPSTPVINHYTTAGIEKLTPAEFQNVITDHVNYLTSAVDLVWERFSKTNERVKNIIQTSLKKEGYLKPDQTLEEILDKKIEGYGDITIRDVLFIPNLTKTDFIPSMYYFGKIPYLGVTYLNAGVIDIDPKARVLDYVAGTPTILAHELIHTSPLQHFPFTAEFDAELWAMFPILTENDYYWFTGHRYLADIRTIAKALFNFDTKRVFADVRDITLVMGTQFENTDNYKKLRHAIATVKNISQVIQTKSLEQFIPEFYAHRIYWAAVNEFHQDASAAFKLYFYKAFEPTILNGPEKTRVFIQENELIVRQASEEVLKEMHQEQNKSGHIHFSPFIHDQFIIKNQENKKSIDFFFQPPATYETRLHKKLESRGFTEEQSIVGVIMGERMLFMNEIKQPNKDTGTIAYSYDFNYGGITTTNIRKKTAELVSIIERILHERNSPWEEYVTHYNLRQDLEKQKNVFTYLLDMLVQKELHDTFQDIMGTRSQSFPSDPHAVTTAQRYNLTTFLPPVRNDQLKFDAKYVNDARAQGKLEQKNVMVQKLYQDHTFPLRIKNPDYPDKDPNKQHILEQRQQRFEIIAYNLDSDDDQKPDYLEVYRITPNGFRESSPAIKIFHPLTSSELTIAVIDKDQEMNKKGFGKPDRVEELDPIRTVEDILTRTNLIGDIFTQEEEQADPAERSQHVHIIETGNYPFIQYQINKNGWESALPDYKKLAPSEKIRIHVYYEKTDDQTAPKKIEHIIKSYPGHPRVVEYYELTKELKNLDANFHVSKEYIEVFQKGKPALKYTLADALAERPYRIDFDHSEDKRWIILDKDQDNKTYEAKQEITRPDPLNLPEPIQ